MKGYDRAIRVLVLLIVEVLLTIAVLALFDLFHHVLPLLESQKTGPAQPIAAVYTAPPEEPENSRAEAEAPGREPEEEPTPIPAEAPLTLRERFSEHFSSEILVTEDSYSSPDISITVTKCSHPEAFPNITYYVADIYLADIACFQACFPLDKTYGDPVLTAQENRALLAINGDCLDAIRQGLLVRNGMVYQQSPTDADLCALFRDGSMETFPAGSCTQEEILERQPVHVWQFGPALLLGDGDIPASFNISSSLQSAHPRTAVGYYEPGHYCFVVVDGRRNGYSDGMTMAELSRLMRWLGCKTAYNLDGGSSSVMVFNNSAVNIPSGDRLVNDMLIIREVGNSHESR